MNKVFPVLLALPLALILCCSGLENPFDSKSPNYLSDTTLVRIMQQYDSTFIDTAIVFDTIVHIDTVIYDTFRIVNQIHYDTSYVLDTLIDTIHHRDTTIFIDTVIHYDSIGYIDTLHIRDTVHFRDTVTHYDTLIHQDTLTFRDTTHFRDTIHFRDTLYHYDTLVHRDTVIDTVRFYRTQPFIYLVKLPDSSVFNTFNYGSTYSLAIKAAGINPAIIQSFSFMPEGGAVWNALTPPWSRTYNTTSTVFYTLRVTTDSGSFANSYTLRCDPASAIRGSKPVFKQVQIRTLTGAPGSFDRTFNGYAPVCTLWTDSAPFSPSPAIIDYINILMQFDLPGCSKYDISTSRNGTYGFDPYGLYDGTGGELELEHTDVPIGTSIVTANCHCVTPDTSQWSGWTSFVFIIRDGR